MKFRIDLAYDGAAFFGWQLQPDTPTVQGALESALSTLLRTRISITGAGRTDTGVHASGYTAHFEYDGEPDLGDLRYKLNAILPDGIGIYGISKADDGFHARFDAVYREYAYFLHTAKDPFATRYSYLCTYHLDFETMNKAAAALLGRHDFSSFEKVGADNKTSVCTVSKAIWEPYSPVIKGPGEHYVFRIAADRFLRNMVRAIVGTLLEVGRGKRSIDNFISLVLPASPGQTCPTTDVASRGWAPRCNAGESVPGKALFLTEIEY